MSWRDPEPIDAFWFAVAPITTIPMAVYSAAGWMSGTYPYGKPDWASSARNTLAWTGIAGSVYGWNLLASPHNAVFVSGTSAFKVAGHTAMSLAGPLMTAAAIAAVPAMVYVGAQQSGPELVETHSGQAETLWGAARSALYLMFR